MTTADHAVRERVRSVVAHTTRTQGEFAARIGLESSKLSRSLGGTRRFTLPELARIAEVGGVSADWLLYGSGVGLGEPFPADPAAPGDRSRADDAPGVRGTRRDDFLRAAWRLIAERGYHAVRVADIARVCGTSSAAVHYYFPAKQDVLNEALRYSAEQAFARQDAELRTIDDGRERLLRLIDMQLPRPGRVRDEWSIWLQFWAEAMLRPELRAVHNEFYARWREAIARIIARGQRQRVLRADVDAAEVALRFSALIDGLAIQLLTGAPGITVERLRTVMVDFVARELGA
jgi:AcrR family transcriptional regulator